MQPALILASQSPRRSQLMRMLGLTFETIPADIDETWLAGEDPVAHAERLAREKCAVIAGTRPEAVVVGSDTVVILDGDVLGKPSDEDEAVAMLMRLQGREHTVATGIAVGDRGGDRILSSVECVQVRFRDFDRDTAAAYARTGEPMDKAGAYGIQGYGATLVASITGDYFAVMGLPIVRMMALLLDAGLRYDFMGLRRG